MLHTHPDEHGLVHGGREARVGESWDEGQVILAWDETRDSARIPDDAFNVVLHEFADQLDAENGLTNGAPELGSAQRHARWAEVMRQAFVELQAQVARGEETVLDPYGASEPPSSLPWPPKRFRARPGSAADPAGRLCRAGGLLSRGPGRLVSRSGPP